MRKEQIENMIDRKIETAFSTGSTIFSIVKELRERSKNIAKVLDKDGISYEEASKLDWDKIEKARVKYAVYYVKYTKKRISDMKWISKKKGVISINYYTVWRHLKLRELLLNSQPIESEMSKYFDRQRRDAVVLTEDSINNSTEKNWTSGQPKKPGQTVLRAFLTVSGISSIMISLPEEEIENYELDLGYYKKRGLNQDIIVVPFIKSKV